MMELPMSSVVQRCCDRLEFVCRLGEIPNTNVVNTKAHPGSLPNVQLKLNNQKLWQEFHAETTEMIITKAGRRMFPHLQLNIAGLQENLNYCIVVEIVVASGHRHKHCGSNATDENMNRIGGWTKAGQAEQQPTIEERIYVHPESPASGAHWMQHMVSFNKLKLTNNNTKRGSNVLLTSMHKYIPRIWVFQSNDISNDISIFNKLLSQPHSYFTFKETEFIAVTAYQNQNITQLKINYNPFAKGFRKTGHSRSKRKFSEVDAGEMSEEEDNSSSSFEGSSSPRKMTAATLSRTGVLQDNASTGVVEEIRLHQPMAIPVQNVTSRAENNHRNARPQVPSSRPHTLHRPWLDPPMQVHLPPPPSSTITLPPLPDLSLYNYQSPTCSIPYNLIPAQSRYYPYVYPEWHTTFCNISSCKCCTFFS